MKNMLKVSVSYILILSFISSFVVNAIAVDSDIKASDDYEIPYASDEVEYEEGQVIVTFKDNVKKSKVRDIAEDANLDVADSFVNEDMNVALVSSDALSTNDIMEEMASLKEVAYVEPNYRFKLASVTNDTLSGYQWHLKDEVSADADIDYSASIPESVSEKNVPVVVVADTGVDCTHEDLKDVMYTNDQYNTSSKIIKTATDSDGHGTMIAGIIAATINNNKGVSGIAKAKILPVSCVGSDGYSTTSDIISAIQYALDKRNNGVNVCAINLSLTGDVDSSYDVQMGSLNSIIALAGEAGIVTVCAAGNEKVDTDKNKYFPGGLDNPYIINVGASTRDNKPASFSNYGMESVDVFAPGTDIMSTFSEKDYLPEVSHEVLYYSFENLVEKEASSADAKESSSDASSNASSDASSDASADSGIRIYTNSTDSSIHLDRNVSYGNSKELNSSLRWDVNADDGKNYYISIPFDVKDDISKDLYAGFRFKIIDHNNEAGTPYVRSKFVAYIYKRETLSRNAGDYSDRFLITSVGDSKDDYMISNDDYWDRYAMEINEEGEGVLSAGKYYLVLRMYNAPKSNYSVYIDDFGVGYNLIKYTDSMGTSFSSPIVAGEVALLRGLMPSVSAAEIRARVIGGVDVSPSYFGKCSSGGKVNIIKALGNNLGPSISSVTIKGSVITVKGYNFGSDKGVLTVTNSKGKVESTVVSWEDNLIEVELKNPADEDYYVMVDASKDNTCYGKAYAPVYVESIYYNDSEVTVSVGTPYKCEAEISPANASEQRVSYISSNEEYATVDDNGVITAYDAGVGQTVTITATAYDQTYAEEGNSLSATIKVNIVSQVKKIKLNKTSAKVKRGKKLKLKCKITPANATNTKVVWKSSNKKIATVSSKGVVKVKKKAKKGKVVKITVSTTDGSKLKATCKIKVK